MPTVTKNRYQDNQNFGDTPYGNSTVLEFTLTTAASGGVVGSDAPATALAIGDIVRIGVLPAGFRLHDSLIIVNDAFTASVTGSIGFAYMDGVDSTPVPQDDDYFGTGINLAAAGRLRASNTAVKPVTLPKPAWLILTTAGAIHNSAADATLLIYGEHVGV